MKLSDVKDKIDAYFDNISPEEFYKTLIKYHMRTVFKGIVNGQEFDNVNDYNAEVQRCLAAGVGITAESHTDVAPEVQDTTFLFPGFAHCPDINSLNEDFIDSALALEANQFMADVNNLFHDRIKPAINGMNDQAIGEYKGMVTEIRKYLDKLAAESNNRTQAALNRLQELEDEINKLSDLSDQEEARKSVIDFVSSLYDSISKAIDFRAPQTQVVVPGVAGCPCGCGHQDPAGDPGEKGIVNPGEQYIADIQAKARSLFGL